MQGTMRATTPLAKPRLGLPAICNLSFGFFGIQIAFALQTANVSGIFQTLGASMDALPILWIAGPVTGLLVQPIIGYLSDRTWGRLGRRRPYFLAGAVAGALALATLANAPYLWLAVLALWVLDVSVNVSMEPFRAFVGDMLPTDQQTTGYAVQTILIGLGASVASAGPYLLTHFASVAGHADPGVVADSTRLAFDIGAVMLLGAVVWTVASTREYSPTELEGFAAGTANAGAQPANEKPQDNAIVSLARDLIGMPVAMRRLAVVQFFSWSGLFIMWVYATPVVAKHHFLASATGSPEYNAAALWVGWLFAAYNIVATGYAFLLPWLAARCGQERIHAVNLLLGGLGLAGFWLCHDPNLLWLAMIGIGIAWASILTMPYAILCGAIPYRKFGTYMGLFNFFIVLPQIFVAGTAGYLVRHAFPLDPAGVMLVGGGSLGLAAALSWRGVRA